MAEECLFWIYLASLELCMISGPSKTQGLVVFMFSHPLYEIHFLWKFVQISSKTRWKPEYGVIFQIKPMFVINFLQNSTLTGEYHSISFYLKKENIVFQNERYVYAN